MGTALSEVYDLFLQLITDYRLIVLYNTSVPNFETFLEAWLTFSTVDFNMCNQSLIFDSTTKTFSVTLEIENKTILANLMVKYWMERNCNDITQFNIHVDDKDFKTSSEANNLKEKQNALVIQREKCSQLLVDYEYRKTTDWADWFNQNFAGV